MMKKKMMSAGGNMKKKGYAGGGVGMKKGYAAGGVGMKKKMMSAGGTMKKKMMAAGGMPMAKDPKTGKMMPKFAMDGVGKMAKGGNAMKKKGYAGGGVGMKKGYSIGGTTAAKKKKLMARQGTLAIQQKSDKDKPMQTRSPAKRSSIMQPSRPMQPRQPRQPMRPKPKTMTPAEKMFMEGYKKGMRDAQSKGVTASKGASMEKKKVDSIDKIFKPFFKTDPKNPFIRKFDDKAFKKKYPNYEGSRMPIRKFVEDTDGIKSAPMPNRTFKFLNKDQYNKLNSKKKKK